MKADHPSQRSPAPDEDLSFWIFASRALSYVQTTGSPLSRNDGKRYANTTLTNNEGKVRSVPIASIGRSQKVVWSKDATRDLGEEEFRPNVVKLILPSMRRVLFFLG